VPLWLCAAVVQVDLLIEVWGARRDRQTQLKGPEGLGRFGVVDVLKIKRENKGKEFRRKLGGEVGGPRKLYLWHYLPGSALIAR
jgi:hypothetical protein